MILILIKFIIFKSCFRKQCILSESRFDFLKDLVKNLPDASGPDDDTHTPPATPAIQPIPINPSITITTLPPKISASVASR